MRLRWVCRLAGIGVAAGLLAACGGAGDAPTVQTGTGTDATSPAPSSSSSSSSSSSGPGIPAGIVTGQCFTDTTTYSVVPCTQAHTFQVTAVIKDARENEDPVRRQVLRAEICHASLTKFTGGAPVGLLAVGSPVDLADDPLNAGRIVCLINLRTGDDRVNQSIDCSLKGKLIGSSAFGYTFCVDKVAKGFKIVGCSQPHTGQSTGGYLAGKYSDAYPGEATMNDQRSKQCPSLARSFLGTAARKDVQASGLFVTRTLWEQGYRYGACFVKVPTGTVQKSLQGIGSRPLTSYR